MQVTTEDALWVTGALSLPTLYTMLATACDWCARVIIAMRKHKRNTIAPTGASPEHSK